MSEPTTDAVIAAAGGGARLGAATPKAFVEVGGEPLLRYALDRTRALGVRHTVVAVPPESLDKWTERVSEMSDEGVRVVAGGSSRQASVLAALEALPVPGADSADHVVLVHDAARPCASLDLWRRVAEAARQHGAAIPVVPSVDSLKEIDAGDAGVRSIDRSRIVRAQTPQGFRYATLVAAHAQAAASPTEATDDATLVERFGHPVRAVPGEEGNIKVTTPEDLETIARRLAGDSLPAATVRIGHGYDIHPLVAGRRLILGGVEIDHDRGLDGHSDADSLAHAVTDALLGAAGWGDIGQRFPADDARWKDADSLELLGAVVSELAAAGIRPSNVDATILAEEPKLLPHLDEMRRRLAGRLDLPEEAVNVKATRGEGMGAIGRAEGIAAHAVAIVRAS